jgi:uncharacterized MAPEG superfamily protein
MPPFDFGTQEQRMLWASALLGVVQLVLFVVFSGASGRTSWALGARDAAGPSMGTVGARVDRAWRNYLETFPIFAALVLLATATGKHTAMIGFGSQLYFYGRVIYLPLYAFGIPVVRTLAWSIATAGIIVVLLGIWPGI